MTRPLRVRWLGRVRYHEADTLQRALHARTADDYLLLLEHEHVYTLGTRADPAHVLVPPASVGAALVTTDRGGDVTYHGPGQLVGYPIIRLGDPIDVIAYVRSLEEALIRTCAEFGVATTRVEGRSGVWLRGTDSAPDRKVGAIGIRVSRGVTMHGFALNCDCDLSWYDRIVPCGIRDAAVTTLSAESGRPVTVPAAAGVAERHLADVLGARSWRSIEGTAELYAPGTSRIPAAGQAAHVG